MNKKTEAKCNGSMLTVGFHAANPPLIWRFDLERNHSFTLALQGEDGDWELGVTSPKGDFYPVVHFAAREDAEEAFAGSKKRCRRKGGSRYRKRWPFSAGSLLVIVVGVVLFGLYVSQARHGIARPSSPMTPRRSAAVGGRCPEGADTLPSRFRKKHTPSLTPTSDRR